MVTAVVKYIATLYGILDNPDGSRKRHDHPVALLGGVALFVSFWLPLLLIIFFHPLFGIDKIATKLLVACVVSAVLVVLGVADEVKNVRPELRLIIVSLCVLLAVGGGIGIDKVTAVSGKALELGLVVGNIAAFAWLLGIIFTVKILDGLDGLATGVVLIGSLVMYALTMSSEFYQPNVGFVSLVFAATLLGFLMFNFAPARVYLGESGGLFIGFMLAVLAVISGSKIATALLVMAVPVVDFARVLITRHLRAQPLFQGDREHFHYQLLTYGLSERQVVLIFYAVALVFGLSALFLQSLGKIVVLSVLMLTVIFLIVGLKKFSPHSMRRL